MIAAAITFAFAAAAIYLPGLIDLLDRLSARGIDELVSEALDVPDYEANVNARWQG